MKKSLHFFLPGYLKAEELQAEPCPRRLRNQGGASGLGFEGFRV